MPPHERFGSDDMKDLEDRWKQSIKLENIHRSKLVRRTLPRHLRRNTSSWCRRTAFSASSRAFDLHGETKMARIDQRSPITRSAYAIRPPPQWNEVFGTDNIGKRLNKLLSRSKKTMQQGVQLSDAIIGDGAAMFRHACGLGRKASSRRARSSRASATCS